MDAIMHFYLLAVGLLAVWRTTHLLHAESGPWNLIARFRQTVSSGFFGSLVGCFYCLSLWVSVPFALLTADGWKERLLLWLALSAGAILLERLSSRDVVAAPAVYFEEQELEEQEDHDVRMRKDGSESVPAHEYGIRRSGVGS
jgi:hypothetical protein